MQDYKTLARTYHQAVSEYNVETIRKLTCKNYIQHNPNLATGQAAFVGFVDILKASKTKIINLKMFCDGPYVIMQHKWINAKPFGFDQTLAVHIIRFNAENKIAEHWNVMKPYVTEDIEVVFNKDPRLTQASSNKQFIINIISEKIRNTNNQTNYLKSHAVFCEDDLALAVSEGKSNKESIAIYDLFKLNSFGVVDHWVIHQKIILEGAANQNTMFGFSL